jgi:hypothetical protein
MKTIFVKDGKVVSHASAAMPGVTVGCSIPGAEGYQVDDSNPADIGWSVAITNGVPEFTAPTHIPGGDLIAYANNKQSALAFGGVTVAFVGGPTVLFGTDALGLALLSGKVTRLGQANPPATVNWQTATGFVALTGAQITSAGIAVADFVQNSFDVLASTLSGIVGGAITTTAQVDAASWPSNTIAI